MEKIDFVMIWVDNNDPEWQNNYNQYKPNNSKKADASIVRYRDWENLKYWFRGVEKFTPWVNKIHFITCGHKPSWLNVNAEKLNFINHSDYIPTKYLPVFSANPIEIHLHRIKDLSEHFVYFNDDIFLINTVNPERFFNNGLPCDTAICNALSPNDKIMTHIIANDVFCINSMFNKKEVITKNILKWINFKYGTRLLRTLCLLPWPRFSAFFDPHLPNAFLKSTFENVWMNFDEKLTETSFSRFRSITDVNQYLFRYWQLVTGNFMPCNICKKSTYIEISDNNINEIVEIIKKQDINILVLNDSSSIKDFENAKQQINNALESILPKKSSFEL